VTLRSAHIAAIAPGLRGYLPWMTYQRAGRPIIDMTAVTDTDFHGLTVLIGTRRRAGLLGGLLCGARPAAASASDAEPAGLDRRLRFYHSVEAAIDGAASA
jgi:anti-anti-sigma regulatory factor